MDYDIVCEHEIHFELHYRWERWLRKSGGGICPLAAASCFNCMAWAIPDVMALILDGGCRSGDSIKQALTEILSSSQTVLFEQPIGRGERPRLDQQVEVIIQTLEGMGFLEVKEKNKAIVGI